MASDLEAARELYFRYDGSRFYMSRDGVEQQYLEYRVPPALEADWLAELTADKVAELDQRGNWRSVNFFWSHRDPCHLPLVAATAPKGVFWEKCAYLEHLLRYVDQCADHYSTSELSDVCDFVTEHARRLRRSVRAESSVKRASRIVDQAAEVRSNLG